MVFWVWKLILDLLRPYSTCMYGMLVSYGAWEYKIHVCASNLVSEIYASLKSQKFPFTHNGAIKEP